MSDSSSKTCQEKPSKGDCSYASTIGYILLLAVIFITAAVVGFRHIAPKNTHSDAYANSIPVSFVSYTAANAGAGGKKSGEEIYKTVCAACHQAGVLNAPKTGDKASWAPRLKLGLEGLTKSAIAGKNAMPARGGNPSLSDDDIRATVKWLMDQVK